MSEQNPAETAPEHFAIEQQVFASEPERLPPAAHAATDFDDVTDVELEEEEKKDEGKDEKGYEPQDHSGQWGV